MKGPQLSILLILIRRWRAFALSGTATVLVFLLGYWAQPVRYRAFGMFSPHKLERRAGSSQPSVIVEEKPNFVVRTIDLITFRQNKLTPEAKFIKNDDLLQGVIEQLEIKDFGGNPASPRSLRRRLSLSTPDQGATVRIALDDSNPEFAQRVVDSLMQEYVDYFSAETLEETVSFTSIIQPHLVNAETLNKQNRQALYQIQVGVSPSVADTTIRAGDQTLELQAIGISAQQQLSTIDSELDQLRGLLANAGDSQRSFLQQVIALGEVRKNLLIKLQSTLNLPWDSNALSAALEELENQGLTLNRELTLTQSQYTKFLGSQQAPLAVSQEAQKSATVVSSAALPKKGIRPFFLGFLGSGLLAGAMVGSLVSFLQERRDESLSSLAQIYAQTQLPIFGWLPTFSSQALSIQSLARQDGTEVREFSLMMNGYHQTIQQLSIASLDRIPQVLAFTSMVRDEGKSLTVANLAYLLAKQGKKVVLLDADLFNPSQFKFWSISESSGLCDYMAGDIQLGKALQRLHPQLDLLQAGSPNKNIDVLLNSPGISLLIQEFRNRYDHVLVDTPSLDVSVHGYLLANSADATMLVLRPEHVAQTDIVRLRDVLGRSGTKLWGMVINGLTQSLQSFGTAELIQESQWDANLRLQKQKNISGFELSTLSAINPPGNASENDLGDDIEPDSADAQRRKKQEDYLYRLPLEEVKKLVEVLWEDWSHDIELLLEQEEEVVQQSSLVRDIKSNVKRGNAYLKLSSELQLKEEQEKLNLLAEAYVGQRSALISAKEDLRLYLSILFARTDAEFIPIKSVMDSNRPVDDDEIY